MPKNKANLDRLEWAVKKIIAECKEPTLQAVNQLLSTENLFVGESEFYKNLYSRHLYDWKMRESAEKIQNELNAQEKISELEKALSQMRATLESTKDGILMVTRDGRIVNFNQKFVDMFCFPKYILDTRDESTCLQYILKQVVDPQELFSITARLHDDPTIQGEMGDLHFKDGRIFERYSQPHFDGDQIMGRVWSFRDVTERRKQVQELRLRDSAIHASTHGIIITDNKLDNKILFANPAFERITGYSLGDVKNQDCFLWCVANKKAIKNIMLAFRVKRGISTTASLCHKNGKSFLAEINIAPVLGGDGEVTHFVWIVNDITQQQALQELKEKSAAEKVLTIKALQVAHDLKSPVAAILMLAKSCLSLPEKERISFREAAYRIQEIANNLMTQYRGERTAQDNMIRPCLISALLLSIISEKSIQYNGLPIKIISDIESQAGMATVLVNSGELKRAISNLITNAVEAIDGGGYVKISMKKEKNQIIISIEDNGSGMPEEVVANILKKKSYSIGKKGGTGLGLPHAIETLQSYEGNLSIQSQQGNGTQIIVKLPICEAPSWMIQEIVIENDDQIIILDDDKSIHQAWDTKFRSLLLKNFFSIQHFRDPNECLNYLNKLINKDNIFLLVDYEFVGNRLNGLDVVEKSGVKRSILVTSHYDNYEVIERCQALKVKLLPKMLCSEVGVKMAVSQISTSERVEMLGVKAVLVDDDKIYTEVVKSLSDSKILTFNNSQDLLNCLPKISKHIKFYLDFTLGGGINGGELAKLLYTKGYRELYLISGYGSNLSIPEVKGYVSKEEIMQFL